jgi:hypothetical protein
MLSSGGSLFIFITMGDGRGILVTIYEVDAVFVVVIWASISSARLLKFTLANVSS